jgi:hypothetical protein
MTTEPAGQTGRPPSLALAAMGFLGSTFLPATLMVLVSAI